MRKDEIIEDQDRASPCFGGNAHKYGQMGDKCQHNPPQMDKLLGQELLSDVTGTGTGTTNTQQESMSSRKAGYPNILKPPAFLDPQRRGIIQHRVPGKKQFEEIKSAPPIKYDKSAAIYHQMYIPGAVGAGTRIENTNYDNCCQGEILDPNEEIINETSDSSPGSGEIIEFDSVYVCQARFDIPNYYQLVKPLGQGGYGVVCKAINTRTGEEVAIKKIVNAFKNKIETQRLCREIKMLKFFDHGSVIRIKEILNPLSKEYFNDIYLVTELMGSDLHQIITSQQPLTEQHAQYFIYQILIGLKYIHSANVMHRDLKPGNILVNGDCDIKICDFGLSRSMEGECDSKIKENKFMTPYVATRWYRAPELVFVTRSYTTAVDVWSIGCILYELLARRPLFPGAHHLNQVQLFVKILGTPSQKDLSFVDPVISTGLLKNMPNSEGMPFENLIPQASPEAIDLLQKMLKYHPDERITVDAALTHPFLANFQEFVNDIEVSPISFEFKFEEKEDITLEEFKEEVYKDMMSYHTNSNLKKNDSNFKKAKKQTKIRTLHTGGSFSYNYDMNKQVFHSQKQLHMF